MVLTASPNPSVTYRMYLLIMSPEMMLGKTKARAAMSFGDHNDDYL